MTQYLPARIYSSQVIGKTGDNIFFTAGGAIYAYSPTDGSQIWTHPAATSATKGPPAVSEDGQFVFAGADDATVVAIFVGTGAQIWQYTANGPVYPAPTVSKSSKMVFVTSVTSGASGLELTVHAINSEAGCQAWSYTEKTTSTGETLPVCAVPA